MLDFAHVLWIIRAFHPAPGAILLLRELHVNDVQSFETRNYRVKVLTEEGRENADVQIPDFEKLFRSQDSKAQNIEPEEVRKSIFQMCSLRLPSIRG